MGRPPAFDLDDLAAAGLAVVAAAGWEAVSVRAVAGRLGVSPMALYRVVPDAAGLRRVVADAAARPLLPPVGGGHLAATLVRWAEAAYAHLAALPGLAAPCPGRLDRAARWLDVVEALLARAAAAGIDRSDGVAAVNARCSPTCWPGPSSGTGWRARPPPDPVAADPAATPTSLPRSASSRRPHHPPLRYGLRALTAGLPQSRSGARAAACRPPRPRPSRGAGRQRVSAAGDGGSAARAATASPA